MMKLILSSILILLSASCFESCTSKEAPQEIIKPVAIKEKTQPQMPLVFAHFSEVNQVLPRAAPGPCVASPQFLAHRDHCAPPPIQLKGDEIDAEQNLWSLGAVPTAFFWHHTIRDKQNLVVELVDSGGLPLPTQTTISKRDNLFTVQLEPLDSLPQDEALYLVATVFAESGQKEGTWMEMLTIASQTN